jgi:Predicted integral membrane protein
MGPKCDRLVRRYWAYSELVLNSDDPKTSSSRNALRSFIFRYAPLLLWIGLIFFFSSTVASANQTSRIIGPILHFLFPSASPETIQQYHFFIRKCAHFTEYALLAFWSVLSLGKSSNASLRNYRFLIAVAIVLVVASLDESNQSFEASRTSSIWDVGLDIVGGASMSLAYWLIARSRFARNG